MWGLLCNNNPLLEFIREHLVDLIINSVKKYKKECFFAPFFKMLEAIFELFVPLVIAYIVDQGIAKADGGKILTGGLGLFALALIGLLCAVRAQFYAARAAIGAATGIRHDIFAKIQQFSFSQLDSIGNDTLITRITSDINQVQNGINMTLRLFLRSPFIVFGAMIMAFTIDFKAAFIFVVTIPLLALVVYGIMVITMPLYKRVQKGLDEVLGITRQNLTGVRPIRAFAIEERELSDFNDKNESLNLLQKLVGSISGLTNPVTFVIVNIATLVLLYTGAIKVDSGVLTRGQVIALVNYMSQILVELIKLANLIVTITKALACADRIEMVFKQQGEEEGFLSESRNENSTSHKCASDIPLVEFDKVCMSYIEDKEVLSNISFKVNRGETIGIIGGTGSGKTSLISLIPGFYKPSKGKVLIEGEEISEEMIAHRKRVGVVMQKAALFSGTIRDNLKWGMETEDEDMIEALKKAQAWDFLSEKDGLDTVLAQGGKNLSGGQRQRINIARALVRKPEILILDDSTSALDAATDAALRGELSKLEDTTVFVVAQRTAALKHADHIIVLEDGEMVGFDTHDKLLLGCEVYREIHESQFKNTQ